MSRGLASVLFLGIVGAIVFALPGYAQRGFLTGRGGASVRPHVPFRGGHQGGYLTGPRGHHRPSHRSRSGIVPYLYPYYYPDYYSNYNSKQASAETPPSRVVVVDNSQPHQEVPPPPPPESLVLELQGNHWVRITNSGQREAGAQTEQQKSVKGSILRTITPQQSASLQSNRKLPPAVLVFRDGHKEEVSRYTIVGATIYTKTDYWNNGSWTKKVPIAELNIPATMELNRERGTNFSLPSGPGEIVIRP